MSDHPDDFTVQSAAGPYQVRFNDALLNEAPALLSAPETHVLIDARVADLYAKRLGETLRRPQTILIDATEANKSLQQIIPVMERLLDNGLRRDQTLFAVGGGIIQDITCFIASTLFRGVAWKFMPTTLLAQADSCIGSKSSINLGRIKNVLGTFNPPREIYISTEFLDTLEAKDIRSGIGEILKVHAIDSCAAYDRLSLDYDVLLNDRAVLQKYIRESLLIKRRFIEQDEFDRGIRNIFNYGHSFGHAIESATDFAVPHGIAVAMGMTIANKIAALRSLTPERTFARMQPALRKNYAQFAQTPLDAEKIMAALTRDKKNTAARLMLILPTGDDAQIQRVAATPDDEFRSQLQTALQVVPA